MYPEGNGKKGRIPFNQKLLTYTIFFQNTGNDTAFNINIEDTLDSHLDFGTFTKISSSHPVEYTLSNTGQLSFYFKNIQLPYAKINQEKSNGYVTYSIMAKSDSIKQNATIKNRATIFFDYNTGVLTNTTINTYDSLYYTSLNNNQTFYLNDLEVNVYPNPTHNQFNVELSNNYFGKEGQIQLFDIYGRQLFFKTNITNKTTFNLEELNIPSGTYILKVNINGLQKAVMLSKW